MKYVLAIIFSIGFVSCASVNCSEDQKGSVTCAAPSSSPGVHQGHLSP